MQIVKPYARIIDWNNPAGGFPFDFIPDTGISLLRKIEFCGRVSHRSEDTMTGNSWDRFIRAVVLDHGDWSIVEHASVTCDFLVDRGITHELVRHRLFSFTQESTRFVNYEKKMAPSFIVPVAEPTIDQERVWNLAVQQSEQSYRQLLSMGLSPQIARSVFPNALAARILITGNLRVWRHFLLMRTTRESHPQMREVTIPLLEQFKTCIPILFDDIEPMARQADNVRKPR